MAYILSGGNNVMSFNFEIINKEANIVVVGDFQPLIFHPEWFINKGIIERWNYFDETHEENSKNDVGITKYGSQLKALEDVSINVSKRTFTVATNLETEYEIIRDIVLSTFSKLKESSIIALGFNYVVDVHIKDEDDWKRFGQSFAPHDKWKEIYREHITEENSVKLGLWQLSFNLPRYDDLEGHVRPRIEAAPQVGKRVVKISINDHVQIDEGGVETLLSVLNGNWTTSQNNSIKIIEKILND